MSNNEIKLPIDRLSYSSMTQLLRNPLIFKMKYILGVYETKTSVSGMIGRAGHEALKFYYGGNKEVAVPANRSEAIGLAKEVGLTFLTNQNDSFIEYGKTGSREAMLKAYTQAMDFYFSEEPVYHKVHYCEEKMTAEVKTFSGDILPLPIVGTPDLVVENKDGSFDIIDTKFVTTFTDYESEDYIKIIQAQFMDHLLFAAKGIKANKMYFREIKRSANKSDEFGKVPPQVRDWVVPLDHEPYRIIFYNLFKDVVKFLSNSPVFLPNLSDTFDGEQSGLIYAQGLINADMSDVEVMHKVRDVAFTSKKFVTSRTDSAENKNLLPEEKVKMRLAEFGIPVEPVDKKVGASVTQYRFKVSAGIRMSTIKKHKDDIALVLEAKGHVKIVAPIPGTSFIGVEVENNSRGVVKLSSTEFKMGTLSLPLGVNVHGDTRHIDLRDMPHLLVAGATGSGKSYLIHSILVALTIQMMPEQMQLVLIDPKRVELSAFEDIRHLHDKPIIYEYDAAVRELLALTAEMEDRYKIFKKAKKRDIKQFNDSKKKEDTKLPYIVVVIDEFADFIMQSKIEEGKKDKSYSSRSKHWLYKKVASLSRKGLQSIDNFSKADLIDILEDHDAENDLNRPDASVQHLICRLAQMGRAAGIHLIIATQRPSVDVISGVIKANFPTRIALTVSSPTDSIVILGVPGAETLAGKGDMLLMSPGRENERLQGFAI